MQIIQVLKERYTTARTCWSIAKNMHAYLVQENDHVKQALADIAAAMAQWVAVVHVRRRWIPHRSRRSTGSTGCSVSARTCSSPCASLSSCRCRTRVHSSSHPSNAQRRWRSSNSVSPASRWSEPPWRSSRPPSATTCSATNSIPSNRVVIAAGAVLPFAGRFVKGGHALYTAARMERLYGQEAARWSLALAAGEKMSEERASRGPPSVERGPLYRRQARRSNQRWHGRWSVRWKGWPSSGAARAACRSPPTCPTPSRN